MTVRIGALAWRIVSGATAALAAIGSLLIVALMIVIGVDVFGRNVLDTPLPGVPELVSLSILGIVFLQAPRALQLGRLTRSDSLLDVLGRRFPGVRRWVEHVHDLAGAFVFAVVAWGTWPLLLKAIERQQFVGAIGDFIAPVWPVRLAVLIGAIGLCLHFLLRILRRSRLSDGAS